MNKIIAVFASATTANRVKRAIGGDARIIQTPKALGIKSCSYSLVFNEEQLLEVKNITKNQGSRIKALFYKNSDGSYEKI